MAGLPFDGVASIAAWLVVAYVMLQAYACIALLPGRTHREARWALAALFGLNALVTVYALPATLDWGVQTVAWGRGDVVDDLTNGALVLSAELAAAAVLGRRRLWVAWPAALAVGLLPVALRLGGLPVTSTYTLVAYAYAAVRLGHAHLAARSPEGLAWTPWLLAAFTPRFVEFLGAYGIAYESLVRDWWPVAPLAFLALAAGVGLIALGALREQDAERRMLLGSALLAGAMLAVVRTVGAPTILLYGFSLAVLRPGLLLLGMSRTGLLGGFMPPGALLRAATLGLGAGATFAAAEATVAASVPAAPLTGRLMLAGAAAIASLPGWMLAANRLREAAGASAASPGAGDAGDPTPGLDPACRFGSADVERYRRLADCAGALTASQRATLAALTRGQRVLLALRGSSQGTLGRPEFSQAGLQFATHVPYRYLATVIKGLNAAAEPRKLIESSTGVRGVRHYWLTEHGRREADELAERLGLAGDAGNLVLGEAFFEPGSAATYRGGSAGAPA
jgi:hypothetical protein